MRGAWVGLSLLVACGGGGTATTEGATGSPTGEGSTTASVNDSTSSGTFPNDSTGPSDSTGPAQEGWQVVRELGPELGMAMSVWGPTAADARVVGGQRLDEGSTGFVLRRTAEGWDPEPLPASTPMLHWIGAAGPDLWTVGLEGTALRREDDAWVVHPTPTDRTLWGVWGAADDDVWAVGGNGVDDPPTMLHFDGASWGEVMLPALPPESNALFKVWGADAAHVFAVGDGGALLQRVDETWDVVEFESIAPFIAAWGRGPEEVLVVGGRSNARLARWDGADWQDVTLLDAGLNGVWIDDEGMATLVGRVGGIFELPAGSLRPTMIDPPTNLLLHAVHGFEDGSRIAVGGSFEGPPPWVGLIVEHPG